MKENWFWGLFFLMRFNFKYVYDFENLGFDFLYWKNIDGFKFESEIFKNVFGYLIVILFIDFELKCYMN